MKTFVLAAALAASLTGLAATTAQAQTRLDHDVQKLWDDTFDPRSHGSRTNWERQRDANRRAWCRQNASYERCLAYGRR